MSRMNLLGAEQKRNGTQRNNFGQPSSSASPSSSTLKLVDEVVKRVLRLYECDMIEWTMRTKEQEKSWVPEFVMQETISVARDAALGERGMEREAYNKLTAARTAGKTAIFTSALSAIAAGAIAFSWASLIFLGSSAIVAIYGAYKFSQSKAVKGIDRRTADFIVVINSKSDQITRRIYEELERRP